MKITKIKRIETVDFRTFCKGGSPAYVEAKRRLEESYKKQQQQRRSFTAYSLYINPLAFFDVHFMLAAGAVVIIAILEKKLAENGIISGAAILSGVLKMGLPVVAFGSVIYLISQLGVFL